MISQHNFRRNRKGIGTVFGMVFFILIVVIVMASLLVVLNQNTGLEQATIQAKQLDLNRYTELEAVSVSNSETAVLDNAVYISCTITDNGTLPAELIRLWINDITTGTVGNVAMSPSILLQPGSSINYFNFAIVAGSSPYDQFSFWFVTTRGNLISSYPSINQFNGITSIGAFPGVTFVNSTYTGSHTPLILSLSTDKPNQLVYVVVSYDDGNTLYTPTSTPSLTWTLRGQCQATDHYSGDSILKTFYAIMPSPGPITINIQSTADELQDYYCSALAFAISGVNTTSPFDGSAQTSIGYSLLPQDTINVHYSNDLIIGALGIDNLNPAITPGAGFGQIMPVQSSYGASGQDNAMPRSVWSEWAILANPRTNLPVNCSFTNIQNWAILVDAVRLVVIPPVSPLSLSPNSGPIGQQVTVSGQGFAPNSPLIISLNGTRIQPFSYVTDGSGNIPSGATFTVPEGLLAGNYNFTVVDNSFNYASTTFNVTASIINVSPTIGPIGTSVTVTGSNFIENSTISIRFDDNIVGTNPSNVKTNAAGFFLATFNASDNAGVETVLASDGVNSASANFTITSSIILSPNYGLNGTQVTVSGTGFAANSNLIVTFNGTTISPPPTNLFTDSTGSFNNMVFAAQSPTIGPKLLNVTDSIGNSISAIFNLVTLDHFGITGYPSSIVAGQSFGSNNVVVTACDASGDTLPGYVGQIYFVSTDSQANLPFISTNSYTFTIGDNGVHTFAGTGFTLKTSGSQTISVTDGSKIGTSVVIPVTPAAAVVLMVSGYPSSVVAGTSASLTVTAKDVYGNTATGYIGAVSLTSSDGLAVLPGNYAFQASDAGIRSFNITLKTVGLQSITATDVLTSSITGAQSGITVNAAGLSRFAFNAVGAQTAGSAFNITGTAMDAYGNTVTSYAGTPSLTYSAGSISPNVMNAFVGGVGSNSVNVTAAASPVSITATDGGHSGTSNTFTVNPAAVSKLAFSGGGAQTLTAGATSPTAIVLQRQDAYGNPVSIGTPAITVNLNTSSSGGAFYSDSGGTTLITSIGIVAGASNSVGFYYKDTVASASTTLTGASSGLTSATTQFTVNHATASSISVAPSTATITAGNPQAYTATATDAYGNNWVATGSVTWSITSGAGGSWVQSTGTYTSAKAGTWTVTATLGVSGTATLTVNPAAVSKLAFSGGGAQTLTAGVTSPTAIVVERQDAYGNPVSTGTAQITVALTTTSSGGAFYSNSGGTTMITSITIAAGVSDSVGFYYKDTVASASTTLTGASSGLTSATTQFTINAAAASKLVFTVAPATVQHYQVSTVFTVQRQDQYGNPTTTGSTIVNLSDNSGYGVFYSDSGGHNQISSVTIASGASTASFYWSYQYWQNLGSKTITAQASGLTLTTTSINVT